MTLHKSRNLELGSSQNVSLHAQTTDVREEIFPLQPKSSLSHTHFSVPPATFNGPTGEQWQPWMEKIFIFFPWTVTLHCVHVRETLMVWNKSFTTLISRRHCFRDGELVAWWLDTAHGFMSLSPAPSHRGVFYIIAWNPSGGCHEHVAQETLFERLPPSLLLLSSPKSTRGPILLCSFLTPCQRGTRGTNEQSCNRLYHLRVMPLLLQKC